MMDNILEKIYKVGLKFLVPLTVEENYALIVKEAMKLVKADAGSILILEDSELRRVYASDPVFYEIKPRKRDFMYRVMKTQKPMILDVKKIARSHPEVLKTKVCSDVLLPISNRNQSIGVLSIMSTKKKYFSQKEVDILKLFIPIAVLSIRKAQLYSETQQTLKSRNLFISMAAHEFRTPLTTINGYIQLLQGKFAGIDAPESRWTEELCREISRLISLVNELLAIHRIETNQFHYVWRECSLKEIIQHVLQDSEIIFPNHRIVFEDKLQNRNDTVIGDGDKLLQVLTNLLNNAAKFSQPGTIITISLKFKSPSLILSIKDQGQGIAKRDLPEIFDSFYQGKDVSKESGMGLGLYIARNIIRQHRGFIKVNSKKGKGTTVEIRLPAASYLTP